MHTFGRNGFGIWNQIFNSKFLILKPYIKKSSKINIKNLKLSGECSIKYNLFGFSGKVLKNYPLVSFKWKNN